jgi:hypothetical protein
MIQVHKIPKQWQQHKQQQCMLHCSGVEDTTRTVTIAANEKQQYCQQKQQQQQQQQQ